MLSFFVYAQKNKDVIVEKPIDNIVYDKNTETVEERSFSLDLKEKYNDKDFQYTEQVYKEEEDPQRTNSPFLALLVTFMANVFPFLLGGFIIFVILKSLIGFDFRFWKSSQSKKRNKEKLIYEDEDIHDIDLDTLLQQAIDNANFRLAIRYYYLTSLKGLSSKKIIDYHKDKTNSEYLFEIKNTDLRKQFSYLSYVYSYVWYGEFSINEQNFKTAQTKYQSFIKAVL